MANTSTLTGSISTSLTGTHGSMTVSEPFSVPDTVFTKSDIDVWQELYLKIPSGSTATVSLAPGTTTIKYLLFVTDVEVEVRINDVANDAQTIDPLYVALYYSTPAITNIYIKNIASSQANISGHLGGK